MYKVGWAILVQDSVCVLYQVYDMIKVTISFEHKISNEVNKTSSYYSDDKHSCIK